MHRFQYLHIFRDYLFYFEINEYFHYLFFLWGGGGWVEDGGGGGGGGDAVEVILENFISEIV